MQNDSTSLLNCPFRLYEFTNIDNFAIEPKNFNKSLFIANQLLCTNLNIKILLIIIDYFN
jgi:hypothetical protein